MKMKQFAVPRELFIFKMFSPIVSAFTFKHTIWTSLILQAHLLGPSAAHFGETICLTMDGILYPMCRVSGLRCVKGQVFGKGKREGQCSCTFRSDLHEHI